MSETKWNDAMIKAAVKDGDLNKLKAAKAAGLIVVNYLTPFGFVDADRDILLWANSEGLLGANALGVLTRRDLDTLKWATSKGFSGSPATCMAADENDYEKLEWILSSGYGWHPNTPSAATKHVDMLKFVISRGCPWNNDLACSHAMIYGRIDALTWAVENGCPWTKSTFEKDGLIECRNRPGMKEYIDELFLETDRKAAEEKALADAIEAEERDMEAFTRKCEREMEDMVKAKKKEISDRKAVGFAKILAKKAALDKLKYGDYRDRCREVRLLLELRYPGRKAGMNETIRQDRSLTDSQMTRMYGIWDATSSGAHAGTPNVIDMADAQTFLMNAPAPECRSGSSSEWSSSDSEEECHITKGCNKSLFSERNGSLRPIFNVKVARNLAKDRRYNVVYYDARGVERAWMS